MTKNKQLFTSLFILSFVWVNAQQKAIYRKHYYHGYLITNEGDTLFGRIKSQHNYDYKIRFIPEADSLQKSTRVPSSQIRAIKVNLLLLEKVEVKGKPRMLELVANGYYDLFAYKYQRGDVSENRYVLRLKDQNIRIDEDNFMEIVKPLVADCPHINNKLANGEYDFSKLILIFRQYNRWKEPDRKLSF